MKTFAIVVGLVVNADREVLMLKRSGSRRHAAGKWEPVSGFIREHESTEAAVTREILEETGLRTEIVRAGPAFEVHDDGASWIIKPFLMRQTCERRVAVEAEHDDYVWAAPETILAMDCVGGMRVDFEAVGLL